VVFPVLLPYWVLFLPIPNPLVASPRPSKYRVVNCPVASSDGYPSQRGLVAGVRLGSMAGYGLFCGGVAVSSYVHNCPPPPFWRTYPGFLGLHAQLSVLVCPPLLVISRSSPLWHYLDVNCQVSSSVLNSSHHPYVLCTQTPTRWE